MPWMPIINFKQFDGALYSQQRSFVSFLLFDGHLSNLEKFNGVNVCCCCALLLAWLRFVHKAVMPLWEFLLIVMVEYLLANICCLWNLVLNKTQSQFEVNHSFRVARCVGHLHCDNSNWNHLTQKGCHVSMNEKLWEDHAKKFFFGQVPSLDTTIACKICKIPPTCLVICSAMMYWVTCDASTWQAYTHIGTYNYHVAQGDCRESCMLQDQLLQDVVGRTPKETVINFYVSKHWVMRGPTHWQRWRETIAYF